MHHAPTPTKLVILDRDGVINHDLPTGVTCPEEFTLLPHALDAIALLHKAGFIIAIATNQSAVSKGTLSEKHLHKINQQLITQTDKAGGKISAIYYCTDHPDNPTHRRKPEPGMLEEALEAFDAKPQNTPMVGDALRDLQAAKAAGCPRYLTLTGKGRATQIQLEQESLAELLNPVTICDTIFDAAHAIIARYGSH